MTFNSKVCFWNSGSTFDFGRPLPLYIQVQTSSYGKVINPSKLKEGAQREMGQTGIPHGVPLCGNGMSPATGGSWNLGCNCLFQPRPGGNLRGTAPTLSTDSRPGTPVVRVNARLLLTPNLVTHTPLLSPGRARDNPLWISESFLKNNKSKRELSHTRRSEDINICIPYRSL